MDKISNESLKFRFIQHLKNRRYKPESIRSYTRQMDIFLEALDDWALHVTEVDPSALDLVVSEWRDINANTFNTRMSKIRKFYDYIIRAGLMSSNPVTKDFYVRPMRERPQIMTKEDIDLIQTTAYKERIAINLHIRLLIHAGLRCSEPQRIVTTSVKKHSDDLMSFTVNAEKFSKPRLVVLRDTITIKIMEIFLRDHHVFGMYPQTVTGTTIRVLLRSIRNKLSMDATPHDLRRYYATQLAKEGVPLALISRLLGHKHISTTEIYIGVQDSDLIDFFNLST